MLGEVLAFYSGYIINCDSSLRALDRFDFSLINIFLTPGSPMLLTIFFLFQIIDHKLSLN